MTGPLGELVVDVEIGGTSRPAGVATFSTRGNRLITDFRYDRTFLRDGFDLEPSLPRENVSTVVEGLPGCLADSAPDWWGRNLISRQARARARERGEDPPFVTDVDFLVGVSDETRQGAVRVRAVGSREHLAPNMEVPKLVALPELLTSADQVLTDPDDSHVHEALKALLAAGSATLGGTRPKASVQSGSHLYIAKFPHPVDDRWDVMAWEMTVLDLAEQVGIDTPAHELARIGGRSVLLIRRFDRAAAPGDVGGVAFRRRIGYVSASTLIGGDRSRGHDYLDLQAAIEDHSAAVDDDLADLWRRIAFSVAVHNTDDHLRNHGFLRTPSGWRLSPIFDVNPDPELARPRSTSIDGEVVRAREADALVSAAPYFGLAASQANRQFADIVRGIGNWRRIALGHGIAADELDRFAPVFEAFADR